MDASALRAEIQAIDKTLADLRDELERGLIDVGRYSRLKTDWEKRKAALEARLASSSAPPEDAEFVNREDELHQLQPERLRASRSPYTLVGAPAGYGKSCLLQRLVHIGQADETTRATWCLRYVDFAQDEAPLAHVVQALTGQSSPDDPDAARERACEAVLQELAAPSSEGRRAVLLILDAVERLDGESRQWLYQLLYDLRRRTRLGAQEIITVRVVIAGRAVQAFWDDYARAYPGLLVPRRISLNPFDENAIQELIWNQARAVHIPLDHQTVVQIAEEVLYLSDGHPAVIRRLVDDLAGQSFAIGQAGAYYRQGRERLVRAYLSPVADDLLQGLDARVRLAVQALGVFRRVNANTVQALVRAGVLPAETNEVDLLGDLSGAHLLDEPSITEPFYRDRTTRRVLVLDMAHRSPESRSQYRRLNQVALALYADWISGQTLPDSYLKATQRLFSVVEWLFHALQDPGVGVEALRLGLQAHIAALSEGQPASVADLIAAEIRRDAEVCYLLRHCLGDDGVSIVCSWLEPLGWVEGGNRYG